MQVGDCGFFSFSAHHYQTTVNPSDRLLIGFTIRLSFTIGFAISRLKMEMRISFPLPECVSAAIDWIGLDWIQRASKFKVKDEQMVGLKEIHKAKVASTVEPRTTLAANCTMHSDAYDATKHTQTEEMNIQHQEKMRGTPDEYSLLFCHIFVLFILFKGCHRRR